MTIKQQGGVFGRNPSFNDVDVNTLDVAGQVTAGSLNVDAGTLFVDAVNNFVGIGTAAPGDRLTVNGNIYLGATSRTVYTGGSADLMLQTNTGNTLISRDNGSTEIARFTTTGMAFPSGNGIDFSATAGTGTSELFDDYEEGTWTPSYTPTTGSFTTMTYNNQEGYYTKVGDLVYINCLISTNNSNPSGGSGDLLISGLPYTCGASADHSLAISGVINWGGDYPLAGLVTESSSTIKFQYRTAINGATSSLDVSDMATSTSSNRNYIRFSGCYKV